MRFKGLIGALVLLAAVVCGQEKMILSQGWYPQAPVVDGNSSEFRFVVEYLKSNLGVKDAQLVADRMEGPGPRNSALAPHALVFSCPSTGKVARVDAVLSFVAPEVSLLDLQRECGMPLVYVKYEKPTPPQPVVVDVPKPTRLVGDQLPGTSGWYGIAPGDTSPDGAIYEDERGRFLKVVAKTPFGSSQYWKKI